jgi:chemotaxis protein MotB
MMQHGVGAGQVTQVRGFADQRLRHKEDALEPSNRRISLIVQYLEKKPSEAPAAEGNAEPTGSATSEGKTGSEAKATPEGKAAPESKPAPRKSDKE